MYGEPRVYKEIHDPVSYLRMNYAFKYFIPLWVVSIICSFTAIYVTYILTIISFALIFVRLYVCKITEDETTFDVIGNQLYTEEFRYVPLKYVDLEGYVQIRSKIWSCGNRAVVVIKQRYIACTICRR